MDGLFAGEDYLHILQYDLLHGEREIALAEKTHMVLTEETAIKLFGKTGVIGETVVLKESDVETSFIVQGVLKSLPNTHIGSIHCHRVRCRLLADAVLAVGICLQD